MESVTRAKGAGVKGEAEREKLIEAVRKHVREGKGDGEVAILVSKETGKKVSVHRVRKIRGGVLGIKKPGGHFGRRKAKTAKPSKRIPAKRTHARKAARRTARRIQKAPLVLPKLNGAGGHLRKALAEMEAHAARSLFQARQCETEARVLSTHAKYLRRVLRTMA